MVLKLTETLGLCEMDPDSEMVSECVGESDNDFEIVALTLPLTLPLSEMDRERVTDNEGLRDAVKLKVLVAVSGGVMVALWVRDVLREVL